MFLLGHQSHLVGSFLDRFGMRTEGRIYLHPLATQNISVWE